MTAILDLLVGIHTTDALAVSITPDQVSGYGSSGASANITTGLVVAAPAGGGAPYTCAWTQVTVSPYTWVINASTSASTSFTCNSLGAGTTAEATFRVTVTDSVGAKATADVMAFANNGQPYDPRVLADRNSGPLL